MKQLLRILFLICCYFPLITEAHQNAPRTEYILMEGPAVRYPLQVWTGDTQTYNLCQLEVGRTYNIHISELNNTSGPWSIALAGENRQTLRGTTDLLFVATSACVDLNLQRQGRTGRNEGAYISIYCQDCLPPAIDAPKMMGITTEVNSNALFLIQEVFIGGGCFDISGAIASGYPGSIGTFGNGNSSIGINTGVIISTGNIANASGPNNSPSASTGFGGGSGDPDLNLIAGNNSLYDVAKIEFDFRPTVSQVSFQYAFASEEYCEYANTQYNDIFGFFISGPGINGPFNNAAENIARLPDGQPVAINSVNHTLNQAFYHDNNPPGQSAGCNTGEMAALSQTQFDGYTEVLTAIANVIPCQTYHIKLVIADRGDAIYDSAVFLAANSFNAGSTVQAGVNVTGLGPGTGAAYEGCGDGVFVFTRDGDLSQPFFVNFNISPQSSATPGQDYAPIPSAIIIPAGQTTVTIPVDVFDDAIPEGIETIMLSLQTPCSCSASTIMLEIHDPPPVNISVPDVYVCTSAPTTIVPSVSGGLPGYTYLWSNNSSSPAITVNPNPGANFYSVTVSDNCGQSDIANFGVFASSPTAALSGSGTICQGNLNALLNVEFTGYGPYDLTYSVGGVIQTDNGIYNNPYELPVNLPGDVVLISVSSNGCPGQVSGSGFVSVAEVTLGSAVTPITCNGAANGAINITPGGGTQPYSYNWNGTLPDVEDVSNLGPGTYRVTVTDDQGCIVSSAFTLTQPPVLNVSLGPIQHIDCAHPGNGTVTANATGGVPAYSYTWSNSSTGATLSAPGGTYTVTITDANGCSKQLNATIQDNTNYPTALASTSDILDCNTPSISINSAGSSSGNNITYQWYPPPGSNISNPTQPQISVNDPGTYKLVVSNTTNGCRDTATVQVQQDITQPAIAIALPDTLNCLTQTVLVDGSNSATGPGYSYAWTTSTGSIIGSTNTPVITAGAPGNYVLQVTNINTGCINSAVSNVPQDIANPVVQITPPEDINCYNPVIQVDAGNSDSGSGFSLSWSTTDGHIVSGADSTVLSVDTAGIYILTIVNTTNGCSTANSVNVSINQQAPVAEAGLPTELNCQTSSATLDGSGSSTTGLYGYSWTSTNNAIASGEATLSPTVTASGIYTLSVQDLINGCISIDSVQVMENSNAPHAEATVDDILTCDFTAITINALGSDSGPNYTASWTGPAGASIVAPGSLQPMVNQPGTYTLTLKNTTNSCISTISVDVDQDIAYPQANAGPGTTLNCYVTAYTLDGSASDQGAGFEVSWQTSNGLIVSGADSYSPTIGSGGNYVISIRNADNGCISKDTVAISTDQIPPSAFAGPNGDLNCAITSVPLQGLVVNPATYTFLWQRLGDPAFVSPSTLTPVISESGTYVLSVTNPANGCITRDTVVVTENIATPVAQATPLMTLTCIDTVLSINALASSQGFNYTYTWTTDVGNIIAGGNSLQPLVNQPGNYQLVIRNTINACTDTAMVLVNEDVVEPVAIIANPDWLDCHVLEVPLDAGASHNDPDLTYSWSTSVGHFTSATDQMVATADAPGLYYLDILNTRNGCTASGTISVVRDPDIPVAQAQQPATITCDDPVSSLSGVNTNGAGQLVYQWTGLDAPVFGAANQPNASANASGLYVFTVTNLNNNCASSDTVFVPVDIIAPTAIAGADQVLNCNQTTVTLNGQGSSQGSAFTYEWTSLNGYPLTGSNTLTPQTQIGGTYQLEVTNTLNGCKKTDLVFVATDTLAPVVSIAQPQVINCYNPSRVLQATATGNHPLSYQWSSTQGHIISGANTLAPEVDGAGQYQLEVLNTGNGCISLAVTSVQIDTLHPTAQAGNTAVLNCTTPNMSLSGAGSSVGSQYQYLWSTTNGNISAGPGTLTPTITLPGTYTISVLNMNNGCENSDQVVITQDIAPPLLVIVPPATLTCAVTQVTIYADSDEGATPYNYIWRNSSGATMTGSTPLSLQVSTSGQYSVQAINSSNGCSTTITTTVAQDIAVPTAQAGESATLTCLLTDVTLNGVASSSGPFITYLWTSSTGQGIVHGGTSRTPLVNEPGTYTLLVTNNNNGCSATDQVIIYEEIPREAEVVTTPPPCYGDKASLRVQTVEGGYGPYTYSIDGGSHFSANSFYPFINPGVYQVVVQDINGCEFAQQVNIPEPEQVLVDIDAQVRIHLGDSYQIQAQVNIPEDQIASIQWTPADDLSCDDCLDPLATPTQTTYYHVRITNQNNCPAEDKIQVVVDRNPAVYIPNAFSPYNNDGTNDRFVIYARANTVRKINSLMIFNRWGELVYEVYNFPPNDPQYGWDGYHRGQQMNPAVFAYWTEVELIDGTVVLFKGDVTLMN